MLVATGSFLGRRARWDVHYAHSFQAGSIRVTGDRDPGFRVGSRWDFAQKYSKRRSRDIAAWLARRLTVATLRELVEPFGLGHPDSVRSLLGRAEAAMQRSVKLRKDVEQKNTKNGSDPGKQEAAWRRNCEHCSPSPSSASSESRLSDAAGINAVG